jgi:hypothetical protein
MSIGFPASPSLDEEYKRWMWDGNKWAVMYLTDYDDAEVRSLISANSTRIDALENAPPVDAYTKAESDGKYQLIGDYALNGASYTKAESNAAYQPAGDYAPNGNYAVVGASYTKAESDNKWQPKGSYQPAGNYAVVGASYTKAESDTKWQPKGSYQPSGNYALVGASYTKSESDGAYVPKTGDTTINGTLTAKDMVATG